MQRFNRTILARLGQRSSAVVAMALVVGVIILVLTWVGAIGSSGDRDKLERQCDEEIRTGIDGGACDELFGNQ